LKTRTLSLAGLELDQDLERVMEAEVEVDFERKQAGLNVELYSGRVFQDMDLVLASPWNVVGDSQRTRKPKCAENRTHSDSCQSESAE
jgi:hypothetical protein